MLDLWSERTGLPVFRNLGDVDAKTAIIVPLDHAYRVFGTMYVQFQDYRAPSPAAQADFLNLAAAIAVIINLYQVRQAQMADTGMARSHLEALVKDTLDSPFVKPKLFFAHPEDGDGEVKKTIRETLDEFADEIEILDWERDSAAGNLYDRLRKAIGSCRYALCYVSEPNPAGGPKFLDNRNVLMEAGMFYSLEMLSGTSCAGWIPIREKESPPSPFDLAAISTVTVPRLDRNGGGLDKDAFQKELRARLSAFLAPAG